MGDEILGRDSAEEDGSRANRCGRLTAGGIVTSVESCSCRERRERGARTSAGTVVPHAMKCHGPHDMSTVREVRCRALEERGAIFTVGAPGRTRHADKVEWRSTQCRKPLLFSHRLRTADSAVPVRCGLSGCRHPCGVTLFLHRAVASTAAASASTASRASSCSASRASASATARCSASSAVVEELARALRLR
jgi:hypothetical protein